MMVLVIPVPGLMMITLKLIPAAQRDSSDGSNSVPYQINSSTSRMTTPSTSRYRQPDWHPFSSVPYSDGVNDWTPLHA